MMSKSTWVENPGIYLAKDLNDGILITGPVTAKVAGLEIARSAIKDHERVIMYKSQNGELPVLEIIMELLYRESHE